MKINTKTRYGLRTLIELAMSDNTEGTFQKDIAESQEISNKYLDQIIASLKSAGIISTISGRKSGYILSKDPGSISVYDIYVAFNPELKIIDCLSDDPSCGKDKHCASQKLWSDLNTLIKDYLKTHNLEALALEQKKINQQKQELMFHI